MSQVWMLRKQASHALSSDETRFYICSLSPRTIVYKGQLTSDQIWTFFLDIKVTLLLTYLFCIANYVRLGQL